MYLLKYCLLSGVYFESQGCLRLLPGVASTDLVSGGGEGSGPRGTFFFFFFFLHSVTHANGVLVKQNYSIWPYNPDQWLSFLQESAICAILEGNGNALKFLVHFSRYCPPSIETCPLSAHRISQAASFTPSSYRWTDLTYWCPRAVSFMFSLRAIPSGGYSSRIASLTSVIESSPTGLTHSRAQVLALVQKSLNEYNRNIFPPTSMDVLSQEFWSIFK